MTRSDEKSANVRMAGRPVPAIADRAGRVAHILSSSGRPGVLRLTAGSSAPTQGLSPGACAEAAFALGTQARTKRLTCRPMITDRVKIM